CGVALCVVWHSVWCGILCGVALCVVWHSVWCGTLCGVALCVVWHSVWCGTLCGVALCVVRHSVWCGTLCGAAPVPVANIYALDSNQLLFLPPSLLAPLQVLFVWLLRLNHLMGGSIKQLISFIAAVIFSPSLPPSLPPFSPHCRFCLSGSSDSIIRLWDLGQQRCVHSYAVHTDSVWAVAANEEFTRVYSGGRDACVSAGCV
ncbi:unnamed protein product, partial [Closterium sp. NIES-53]